MRDFVTVIPGGRCLRQISETDIGIGGELKATWCTVTCSNNRSVNLSVYDTVCPVEAPGTVVPVGVFLELVALYIPRECII